MTRAIGWRMDDPRSVIVVTGAASGIGRATTALMAERNVVVVAVDKDSRRLAQIGTEFVNLVSVEGDISSQETIDRVANVATTAGRVAGWVNCAAIIPKAAPILEQPASELRQILETNLLGAIIATQAALAALIQQGRGGAIVNLSSVHARSAFRGWAAYDLAKAGIESFTRSVAVEYGALGIRANCVAPGLVAVERWYRQQEERGVAAAEEFEQAVLRDYPAGRLCQPVEVARVIEFLLGGGASYINGQTVVVDGGFTALGKESHL